MRSLLPATLVVVGSLLVGCEPAGPEMCTPPPFHRYSCAPLPSGSEGCRGRGGWGEVPDPDAVFASGCRLEYPFCHGFFPNEIAYCVCTSSSSSRDGGAPLAWLCPL